ncbi:MAG TPA: uroporphyrinogen decarboxylase [Eubacteriaceae bacterium]|nr:uroporphyrinogen decarboxylase [Eubacteriaceae bacterium]
MSEKKQVFQDVYDGKMPKRVPVNVNISIEAAAEFAGIDMAKMQWQPETIEPAVEKVCDTLYSDVNPVAPSIRLPGMYQFLNSQSFILSKSGYMQHPEVVGMYEEDYDYLIEKPIDCLIERVIPRQFKALGNDNSMLAAISLLQGMKKKEWDMANTMKALAPYTEKYGYFAAPAGSSASTEAPYDYLADQLRSFSGISKDVRRHREKIIQSCRALYDLSYRKGLPTNPSQYGHVFLPLHMPPFMREKDFKELWWPTFRDLLHHYASQGIHCRIFCEQDWSRYIPYLKELPTNTVIWFEYGDPKTIKKELGDKFILTGFYPLTSLKNSSKQQCLDLAKEYIDILAPGGKYIFGFDKIPVVLSDVNMNNLSALTEFVRDYAVYDNPGETTGEVFQQSDYQAARYATPETKYFPTWDRYKEQYPSISEHAKPEYESINESIYQFIASLIY